MPEPVSPVNLPAMGPLGALAEEDRKMLASYGGFQFHQAGKEIIRQGEPQESLFIVLSGSLHARRVEAGREILVGEIRAGESIGEVGVFDPGPASASVVAAGPVQLWRLDGAALREYVALYPAPGAVLLEGLATILARRLRAVNSKLSSKAEYHALLAEIPG